MLNGMRCDSCGELAEPGVPYYDVEFVPAWKVKNIRLYDLDRLSAEVCPDCARAFVCGRMHAEATTGKL